MKLSGPNQLWIADITYIRLRAEVVYLNGCLGRLFLQGRWLVARPNSSGQASTLRFEVSNHRSTAAAGSCAPLRSGCAIHVASLHARTPHSWNAARHEPTSESL